MLARWRGGCARHGGDDNRTVATESFSLELVVAATVPVELLYDYCYAVYNGVWRGGELGPREVWVGTTADLQRVEKKRSIKTESGGVNNLDSVPKKIPFLYSCSISTLSSCPFWRGVPRFT